MDEKKVDVASVFEAQKANLQTIKNTTTAERVAKLKKFKAAIEANEADIFAAFKKDLRKCTFESATTEVFFLYGEIDFAIKNLSKWNRTHKVASNLINLSTKCTIEYEPKGQCLIIAPWNYPVQLILAPLVSSIAAGNTCILKSSKLVPAVSKVIAAIVNSVFDENEIYFIEGHLVNSADILKLPFNHIHFTGSTATGRLVMEAASKYLSSVTLELGGKSPVIIDETADLKIATSKIAWGKFLNSGQTCIAPDYTFIHESKKEAFISLLKKQVEANYFKDGKVNKDDYGKIVSNEQFIRLKGLVDNAVEGGADVKMGAIFEEEDCTIYPTILDNVDPSSDIMQEEIFGPVLPVFTYNDISEVFEYINAREKPLALYIFSSKSKNVTKILNNTSSGGVCVNEVLMQITNPNFSFGGVNGSGIGGAHGFYGFKAFSHERSVLYQNKYLDMNKISYPPYAGKDKGPIFSMLRKMM